MDTAGGEQTSDFEILGGNANVEKQVRDALSLAEFAVASGYTSPDGDSVPSEVISTIQATAGKLGFYKQAGLQTIGGADGRIPLSEWNEFQLAYYKLAKLLSPITAETLRDTEPFGGRIGKSSTFWSRLGERILGASPANRFTRGLWIVAIIFVVFVVASAWLVDFAAQDGNQDHNLLVPVSKFIQILVPYAFGGLGACAYLLRSAHTYIYRRTFDVRREPEYFNRILLGTIAGGTIIMLMDKTVGDEESTVPLSAAALGFIAGYSTDFLFNKIQQIISVLLPKGDGDSEGSSSGNGSLPKAPSIEGDMSLKDLTERHDAAQDPKDRDFYKALIGHLAGSPELGSSTSAKPKPSSSKPTGEGGNKKKSEG